MRNEELASSSLKAARLMRPSTWARLAYESRPRLCFHLESEEADLQGQSGLMITAGDMRSRPAVRRFGEARSMVARAETLRGPRAHQYLES